MKFEYEYRTSDNVPHRGTIAASTKEAAYDTLKAQGIKPGKVWEAPGILNKVFGKGKRWIAIAALLVALGGTATILFYALKEAESVNKELEDITLYEERGQIYGADPVIADMEANTYARVFVNDCDRFLACYAVPAKKVEEIGVSEPNNLEREMLLLRVSIDESDLEEVKKLKRMVNGMKRELECYLRAGGSIESYVKRLDIRQQAEYGIYSRIKRELSNETNTDVWREKNAMLRAKGLPMVNPPEKDL